MRGLLVFALVGVMQAQAPAGTRVDEAAQQDVVNARIRAAEAALEKQDYQGAATALKQLAKERPKDAHVMYDLGFAEERIGDEAGAAEAYAAAGVDDSAMAEPRVALGLMDARAGRVDKAHGELQQAASITTAAPELRGRALRAMAAMDENAHPDAAREELLAAVKLTGETPGDVLMGADMAANAGDNEDAEAAYKRALVMQPGELDATAGLAHSLIAQKKYPEAEAALADAVKAHPDDPRLVSQLATTYASEGKAGLAIPLVLALVKSDKALAADVGIARLLARLYAMDGQNEAAVKLYSEIATRLPKDPTVLDDWGGVLVKQLRYGEAETVFSRAVGMREGFASPEDWAEAAEHLAFAASKNKDPHTTLQALAARATVLPNSPASLFLEAISHDSLRENKAAQTAYRAFLAVANGKYPDEEFEARHRLVALEHEK